MGTRDQGIGARRLQEGRATNCANVWLRSLLGLAAEVILTTAHPESKDPEVLMPRRRRTAAGLESLEELARKAAILERELAQQRHALDRLKQLGAPRKRDVYPFVPPIIRKSA